MVTLVVNKMLNFKKILISNKTKKNEIKIARKSVKFRHGSETGSRLPSSPEEFCACARTNGSRELPTVKSHRDGKDSHDCETANCERTIRRRVHTDAFPLGASAYLRLASSRDSSFDVAAILGDAYLSLCLTTYRAVSLYRSGPKNLPRRRIDRHCIERFHF